MNLHKLAKLKLDKNSSQNPSPDKISQASAPPGLSFQTEEVGSAKNGKFGYAILNFDYQTLKNQQFGLRIPQNSESATLQS